MPKRLGSSEVIRVLQQHGFFFATQIMRENGVSMPQNRDGRGSRQGDKVLRFRDCAVIDFAARVVAETEGIKYQTVRGVFLEGKPAFPGSKIAAKSHIQIAGPGETMNELRITGKPVSAQELLNELLSEGWRSIFKSSDLIYGPRNSRSRGVGNVKNQRFGVNCLHQLLKLLQYAGGKASRKQRSMRTGMRFQMQCNPFAC